MSEEVDITKKDSNNILINKGIDYNLLISSIPDNIITDKTFTKDVKELINALSFTYNLNTLDNKGLVCDSINEKGLIDKTKLRKASRDYYQLKAKYKGAEPTDRDKRLIESLLVDQKLNPGVVNVLISYVLKTNNQQLKKSYVETIAGQWKRLNIETVEEAMDITEKEHKKLKRLITNKTEKVKTKTEKPTKEELPVWFNKTLDKEEASEEDIKEMDDILSGLV